MQCGAAVSSAGRSRHARLAGSAPTALVQKLRATPVTGERKVVTAIFADVVGSTSLAETIDPEEWVGIMNGAFDLMSGAVYRYEGTIASLVGDGLLSFFGAPLAHEDDPERAALSALAMTDVIGEFGAKLEADRGIDFRIRVGINTGEVVVGSVGSDLRYEYTAIGDTMNVAARVQDMAEPGTVFVTSETYRFIASRFDAEDHGEIQVKGRTRPVHAFRLLGMTSSPTSPRGLTGHRSSLVGRESELSQLHEALALVRNSGKAGSAIVTGEAGMGKSRLLMEFGRQTRTRQALAWAEGQSVSYGVRFPYHVIADLVRSLIGVSARAGERDTRAALQARMKVEPDENDLFVLEHLLLLREVPEARRLDTFEPMGVLADYVSALQRLIDAVAVEEPLVLVCEDLHWIDPSSAEILTRLAGRLTHLPVLWVFTSRGVDTTWGSALLDAVRQIHGANLREVFLAPMDRSDGEHQVAGLLDVQSLPRHVIDLILDRSDGNPYFVEETIRMLRERGVIELRDGRWVASSSITSDSIPANLMGLLLARIDSLPPDARFTLLIAAVIGRSFEERILREVLERTESAPRPDLDSLLEAELIQVSATDPYTEYRFRHALQQEAAYGVLLKGERQKHHRAVGETFGAMNPGHRDEMAALLAYHFELGEDPERALTYLLLAGRHALARFANHEARELLDRAAALGGPRVEEGAARVELDLDRAQAGYSFVPFDDTLRLLEQLRPPTEELGDRFLLARLNLLIGRVRSDRGESYNSSDDVRRALDEALRLGTALHDDHVRAVPLSMIGSAKFNAGDYRGASELLTEAFRLLESFEDHAGAALAGATLARAHARLGNFSLARRAGDHAAVLAERSGDANVVLDVKIFLGMVAAEQDDLDEAMRLTRDGVRIAEEVGNTYCTLVGSFHLGDQQLRLGREGDAISSLERSRELAVFCAADSMLSLSDAWLGAARSRSGEPELGAFDGPLDRARAFGDRYAEAMIRQLRADARTRLPDPDWDGSVDDLRAAARELEDPA
jgi:class 3 adenylate cyclase/tetratricopeptide (TPR) repeat protein